MKTKLIWKYVFLDFAIGLLAGSAFGILFYLFIYSIVHIIL